MKSYLLRYGGILFWILLWQLGAMALGHELLLPSPFAVLIRLGQLLPTLAFWQAIGRSLVHMLLGFLLGALTGGSLRLLAWKHPWLSSFFSPLQQTIQGVPVVSIILLLLVLLPSHWISIFISFCMVMPIFYNQLSAGIAHCRTELAEMAQVFQIPLWRRVRYLLLPQIVPSLDAACKNAIGLGWKACVAAEVIGMVHGTIGEALQQAKVFLDTTDVFAWTLVVVSLSACLQWVLHHLLMRLSTFREGALL